MRVTNLIVVLFFVFGICTGSLVDVNAATTNTVKSEKKSKKSTGKVEKKKKAEKKDKKLSSKAGKTKAEKKKVKKKLPAVKSVSLNRADKSELMTLPGIGPKMADAIIKYRKANKFTSIKDLTKVKGIGSKRFSKLEKYIKP